MVNLFFAVYIPVVIQDQMLFKQFTMLKVFLSAVVAGKSGSSLIKLTQVCCCDVHKQKAKDEVTCAG